MGTRIPSHQLSSGLYVSGRPEQVKERQPTMASRAVPYTGGDIKKSGELGKMFDIPVADPSSNVPSSSKPSRSSPSSSFQQRNSGSGPNSGPSGRRSGSGPLPKKSSGPISIQPTGLITSGPLGSGPIGSSGGGGKRSGHLEHAGSMGKAVYGPAVTSLKDEVKVRFRVSKPLVWVVLVVVAMCALVGVFLMLAVKKKVFLVALVAVVFPLVVLIIWNCTWKRRGILGVLKSYPDAELRSAINGQYVKVTGSIISLKELSSFISFWNNLIEYGDMVVTCGSIPLESSYQRVPRCVYVSTELYEYKGWGGKSANPNHRCFSWGCRHSEVSLIPCSNNFIVYCGQKYVADFYISDFQSGLRALVKAGYGAKVAPFVEPASVIDIKKENSELSQNFLHWLADRKLSSDDRVMRLKEGYIKEGSTVSVMGVVQRHDNMLMIVPSAVSVPTACQWMQCLLPLYVDGLILTCDDNQNADVIPV
ncbi:putative membrane protein [Senna tora]|uniref:Putative membrane protein n=1 Tax=Senna tora TaxID=362788 RepID=A0A834SQL5_9FABA|nr:putative membrane protein [Senna tora]